MRTRPDIISIADHAPHFVPMVDAKRERNEASPLGGCWLDQLGAFDPPRWLVRNWIPEASLGVTYGEPGTYKSFFALDIALSLAHGRAFLDCKTATGGALYLALEGGAGIRRRVAAWHKHHDLDPAEAAQRFRLVTASLALADSADKVIGEAAHMREHGEKPALVLIDTLSRALAGANENDSADMGALVGAAETIRAETGATVMLIHHSGKDRSNGARGHSLLRGAVDFEIEARKSGDLAATLELRKQKDGDCGLTINADLVRVDLGVDGEGEPVESLVPVVTSEAPLTRRMERLSDQQRTALEALHEALFDAQSDDQNRTSGHVPLDVWRTYCVRRGLSLSDKPDSQRKAFERAAKSLQSAGIVCIYDNQVSLPGHPDKAGH